MKEVIPLGTYSYGESFNQNRLAIVSKNNRFGVINEYGKEIIKIEFDTIEHPQRDYYESKTFVAEKTIILFYLMKMVKRLTTKLKTILSIGLQFKTTIKVYIKFKNDQEVFGIIGDNGEVIIPIIYDEIDPFRVKYNRCKV